MQITHLRAVKQSNTLVCYTKIKKTKEFDDEALGLEFYPKRDIKFNVDIEDITIREEKEGKVLYLFSTAIRKRKGQFKRFIEKHLKEKELIDDYETSSLLKSEFKELLVTISKRKSYDMEN